MVSILIAFYMSLIATNLLTSMNVSRWITSILSLACAFVRADCIVFHELVLGMLIMLLLSTCISIVYALFVSSCSI